MPRTTPPFVTVATVPSEVVHVTVLSVALVGIIVATNVLVLFTPRFKEVLSRVILVTSIGSTVMTQVADMPFWEAVMFAVPIDTAVTLPLASTVATEVLLETQVILPGVLEGHTVAVRVFLSPTCIV